LSEIQDFTSPTWVLYEQAFCQSACIMKSSQMTLCIFFQPLTAIANKLLRQQAIIYLTLFMQKIWTSVKILARSGDIIESLKALTRLRKCSSRFSTFSKLKLMRKLHLWNISPKNTTPNKGKNKNRRINS
jgi:hypothetical protein